LATPIQGDLVIDVTRAADPAGVNAARDKLALNAARKASAEFTVAEQARSTPPTPASPQQEAFVKFEAMVLQTFLQSMLPKETESVYGEGMAGEMWQSMLAEHLANSLAQRGGIGIADRILRNHYNADADAPEALSGPVPDPARDAQAAMTAAFIKEIELTLTPEAEGDRTTDISNRI